MRVLPALLHFHTWIYRLVKRSMLDYFNIQYKHTDVLMNSNTLTNLHQLHMTPCVFLRIEHNYHHYQQLLVVNLYMSVLFIHI